MAETRAADLNAPLSTPVNTPGARVIVVGGGWAGLSAACTLARAGYAVELFEAARQAGGRARRVSLDGQTLDNGQHLLIGAYHETLRLLHSLDVDTALLQRKPLALHLRSAGGDFTLHAPRLPAPLHLLAALLGSQGLSPGERFRAIGMCVRLALGRFRLDEDISVATLLARHGQSRHLNETLWVPLCLATLNTPPERASARVFLAVLRDSFTGHRSNADLLFPASDLGRLLADPALATLTRLGAGVRLGQRVRALTIDETGIRGIQVGGAFHRAEHVVLAVPPHAATPLLAPHPRLQALAHNLAQFRYEPICTVYLQYPAHVSLPQTMVGLVGTTTQWLIDRRHCGQPGLIAAVISAGGEHMQIDRTALAALVQGEIARHFPDWPAVQTSWVIREKRATFACEVDSEQYRPAAQTPVPGCWLAGDYTRTGYPATLEGAVRSGLQCARQIMAASPSAVAA